MYFFILSTKLREQEGKCYYCSIELSKKNATKDHWIPLAIWNKLDERQRESIKNQEWFPLENIVIACSLCNNGKSNIVLEPALTWLVKNTDMKFKKAEFYIKESENGKEGLSHSSSSIRSNDDWWGTWEVEESEE